MLSMEMAAEQQIRQLAARVQQLTEGLQKVQQQVDSQPTGTVLATAVAMAATTAAKETVRQMQEERREMSNEDEKERNRRIQVTDPSLHSAKAAIPLVLYSVIQKLIPTRVFLKPLFDWLPMVAAFLALVLMSKYQKAQASKTASVSLTAGSEKIPGSGLALKFMDKPAKTPMERLWIRQGTEETKTTAEINGIETVENENRGKQKKHLLELRQSWSLWPRLPVASERR